MWVGEVYRSEDVLRRRGKPVSDVTPRPIPQPITPTSLEALRREMESLKGEIALIKQALRAHGMLLNNRSGG